MSTKRVERDTSSVKYERVGLISIANVDLDATAYCKRGYFRWGKFREYVSISKTFHVGVGDFHDTTPISFIKAYGFYFRVGVIFAKKTEVRKSPPRENFHVHSNQIADADR